MGIVDIGAILHGGTATEQLELALVAERAGWDGVFGWEASYSVDAWTLLAAMAARTSRVRLGTLLTPLPWRRSDLHERADLLDDGIDLIRSLWDGDTSHHGSRYSFEVGRTEQVRVARPVQDHIPIRAWLKEPEGRTDLDGSTWWLVTRWEMPHCTPERTAEVRARLPAGPPRRAA
jgi:alkanesulfonate monooxygenase SsuD/methylene tetrahydromethanopterin reductase-like flavin-dependent oxidoreductase (luciferase family)